MPDGAALPDWSRLTIGDRFGITLRLVPAAQREQLLGKSASTYSRYEQGMDIPLTVVATLSAETEIPLDWIVSGRAMDRRTSSADAAPAPARSDGDDVPIQKLAFKAAAGNGALMLDDGSSYVNFPRVVLHQHGVAPGHARLMQASGESMRETISDGDLMLVDVSPAATQIADGKIYVFSVGNEAYVKRLKRSGDDVIMIADNRDMFPPETVPKELPLRIYGRVKWAGRGL
ncbi:S24 family peptidase [Tardiphaga sp.]|uniref:S24 family peptidase n=1 Tax=Tardiphaga sp. TaxID=1926292 RepID=UPI0025D2C52B|nr:S24 family peptidase [Tardiphaga sp.]